MEYDLETYLILQRNWMQRNLGRTGRQFNAHVTHGAKYIRDTQQRLQNKTYFQDLYKKYVEETQKEKPDLLSLGAICAEAIDTIGTLPDVLEEMDEPSTEDKATICGYYSMKCCDEMCQPGTACTIC